MCTSIERNGCVLACSLSCCQFLMLYSFYTRRIIDSVCDITKRKTETEKLWCVIKYIEINSGELHSYLCGEQ